MVGKEKRLVNYCIDIVIIKIISMILDSIFEVAFSFSPVYLDGLVTFLTYYTLFEYFKCQTIGKMITKTYLVTVNNEKPKFTMVLLRSFLRLVPIDPLSYIFGFNYGIHDYYSKTKLIDVK